MAKAKTSITTENRSGSAADAAVKEKRTEMPLSDLHPFEGHPFKVLDDELMEQTVESIKQIGVVSPLIVRPDPEGGYEILSGHRRLHNAADLEQYLSSGTIKGIITFSMVKEVLHSGGYLLVDEIENHFNKEIVTTLVRFFMDSRLNKNGGTLIFTTHYPELLDEYDRNDGICIVRNRNGITAENLSYILKRNDIKKSDAYQSGFLEGTTPAYEAYMRLKKSLAASIN